MALPLETGNTIGAVAGTAGVIAYRIGMDEITANVDGFKAPSNGFFAAAAATLYTVVGATVQSVVKSLMMANTSGSDVPNCKIFVGGLTAQFQVTGTFTIPAGGTAIWTGETLLIFDSSGALKTVNLLTLTGAVTGSGSATIATVLAIAPNNTLKGNNTGGPASPIDLTPAQVKTMLGVLSTDLADFTEAAQDAVAAALTTTATIQVTYNDPANTITLDVRNSSITNAMLANMPANTIKGNNTGAPTSPIDLTPAQVKALLAITSTDLSDFVEAAQDAVGGALGATATITFTYNDPANTITANLNNASVTNAMLANEPANTLIGNNTGASTSPIYLTPAQVKALLAIVSTDISDFTEAAQDAVAAALTNTATVTWTYNDPANTITATVSGFVPTARNVNTTLPLTGGGNLGAGDLTLAINPATFALPGTESAVDFQRARRVWDSFADFNIIPDLRSVGEITAAGTQIVATAGSGTVNIPNGGATTPFSGTAIDVGKRITIQGAGAAGAVYVGTIVTSAAGGTTCTVTPNVSTTVTASTTVQVWVQWGTDNTTANALMVSTLNASVYPTPIVLFGKYANTDWTNAVGIPAPMAFNKVVSIDGVGGFHTTDTGDYTKIGGTRLAWWGTSSDGGTAFGSVISLRPSGVQSIKRPCLTNCWIDCRNGDQNQALRGLSLFSCHGAMLGSGFGVMDALAEGLNLDIATSPTEARDNTRFTFGALCFRQLDNSTLAPPTTAPTTTTTALTLTAAGQTFTLASVTGFNATGGYAWFQTTIGRPFLVKYSTVTGSTLTGCVVSAEDVIHQPTTVSGCNVVPCTPSNAKAINLSGGSGANTCCGFMEMVQVSYGITWGPAVVDFGNSDSIIIEQFMQNGGSNVNDGLINRMRRPGMRFNSSKVSATLATRNNIVRDGDPGGPSGGGISIMALDNTGAIIAFPATPNYIYDQQMGNGAPIPTLETGAYTYWNGNGMLVNGKAGPSSIADQLLTAATLNKVIGTVVVLPPQGWQVGTTIEWVIPAAKTIAGGLSTIVQIRQNATGVAGAGGTVIATVTYTGTALADSGSFRLRLVCTALGAGTATALATFELQHNSLITGLSTGVTVPASTGAVNSGYVVTRPTMAAFDSTLPNVGPAFLFVEINPVTALTALTCQAPVAVNCSNPGNP